MVKTNHSLNACMILLFFSLSSIAQPSSGHMTSNQPDPYGRTINVKKSDTVTYQYKTIEGITNYSILSFKEENGTFVTLFNSVDQTFNVTVDEIINNSIYCVITEQYHGDILKSSQFGGEEYVMKAFANSTDAVNYATQNTVPIIENITIEGDYLVESFDMITIKYNWHTGWMFSTEYTINFLNEHLHVLIQKIWPTDFTLNYDQLPIILSIVLIPAFVVLGVVEIMRSKKKKNQK